LNKGGFRVPQIFERGLHLRRAGPLHGDVSWRLPDLHSVAPVPLHRREVRLVAVPDLNSHG
jgi:hypothetical protein